MWVGSCSGDTEQLCSSVWVGSCSGDTEQLCSSVWVGSCSWTAADERQRASGYDVVFLEHEMVQPESQTETEVYLRVRN